MKIYILIAVVILLLYTGGMSYFYFDLSKKHRELIFSLDETQDFKRKLQEEIAQMGTSQQNLKKENEQLKKESLSYLTLQKEVSDKRRQIENLLKLQNQKLKTLTKQLKDAKHELEKIKAENQALADINDLAGNVQVKNQKDKIGRLQEDLSATRGQLERQIALLYYNLGVSYVKENNYEMAVDAYERTLLLNPNDADAHYNLAIIYDEYKKNPKRAVEHYKKYLQLNPDTPDIDEVKEWIERLEK